MAYFFRNQNNYVSVPYPSGSYPRATVKSGGCGVCAACNALDNLFDKVIYSVKTMAAFSLKNGGRSSYGTDMSTLLRKLSSRLGTFTYTYHAQSGLGNALIKHLKSGGTAILSTTGGKTAPGGLFSTSGHLYTAVGYSGDNIYILDSGYYAGKYNIMSRQRYATVKGTEPYLSINKKYVEQASQLGGWLLSKKKSLPINPPGTKRYYINSADAVKFYKDKTLTKYHGFFNNGQEVEVKTANAGIVDNYQLTELKLKGGKTYGLIKNVNKSTGQIVLSTFVPPKKYMRTTADTVFRSNYKNVGSADKSASRILVIPQGASIEVLCRKAWSAHGYKVTRIKYAGKIGYVADSLLR